MEQMTELNDVYSVLTDLVVMAENEIQRIKTGYAPGPSMRDTVGQWEATVREARKILAEKDWWFDQWLANAGRSQD